MLEQQQDTLDRIEKILGERTLTTSEESDGNDIILPLDTRDEFASIDSILKCSKPAKLKMVRCLSQCTLSHKKIVPIYIGSWMQIVITHTRLTVSIDYKADM